MTIVRIDGARIVNWESFHNVFSETFGFPDFYGRNMNAWIDCLTDIDDDPRMTTRVQVEPGGILTIQLENVDTLIRRFPDGYSAIVECSAFVNHRRIDVGEGPVIALSFWRRDVP